MQPQNVSLACNVMGVSGLSCDASVETLPYLADNKVWVEL